MCCAGQANTVMDREIGVFMFTPRAPGEVLLGEARVHLLRASLLRVLESKFLGDSLYKYTGMRIPTL